jgi:diguanylate cyclase
MCKSLRVLIVEDSKDDAELLVIELEKGGYDPIYTRVDTEADMQAALEHPLAWDIILADYSMPEFSAIAALSLLRKNRLDLPFIIISGKIGEDTAVAAMKAGAHDYIVKGKLARLLPAIARELREAVLRKEHRRAQDKLKYLAYYDELTGLPNRSFLLQVIERLIKDRDRDRDFSFAVIFVNLERFQLIKYSLGHILGDRLLVAASRRLEKCLDERSIVTRVGTEQFAILVTDLQRSEGCAVARPKGLAPNVASCEASPLGQSSDAKTIATKIYYKLSSPFKLNGPLILSNISIGIASSDLGYKQPEKYLQAADTAMHYARVNGIEKPIEFAPKMHASAIEKLQLESDLQQAIRYKALHLNYQPIVSLITGKITGFEALLRWNHPQRGKISPETFIPLSEETGLIVQLGEWVLSEACRQLMLWEKEFSLKTPLNISVNLSGIQLNNPNFLTQIDNLLESLGLDGEFLKLEITESVLMENASSVTDILRQLKQRKIKLCIDDFGIGYSSLSYLRYLPIDTLKIDRSFINQKINTTTFDILKAIVDLSHSLGLDIIAEGVETKEQLLMLQILDCEYGQGYYFSKPLEKSEVLNLMLSPLTVMS